MTDYPPLHGPSRPEWTCVVCAEPWPCLVRKRQLRELCQGDVRALVRYLGPYLSVARTEIEGATADEVTERFVGWCGRPLAVWVVTERRRQPPGRFAPEPDCGRTS